jgi:hypothetical protein
MQKIQVLSKEFGEWIDLMSLDIMVDKNDMDGIAHLNDYEDIRLVEVTCEDCGCPILDDENFEFFADSVQPECPCANGFGESPTGDCHPDCDFGCEDDCDEGCNACAEENDCCEEDEQTYQARKRFENFHEERLGDLLKEEEPAKPKIIQIVFKDNDMYGLAENGAVYKEVWKEFWTDRTWELVVKGI